MLQTISPVAGSVYVERETATAGQIDETLALARKAQSEWKEYPVAKRAEWCSRMVDAFVVQKDRIAAEITWQMGRPIRYTPLEVLRFEERARYIISAAGKALTDVQVEPLTGFTRFIRRDPVGGGVLAMTRELAVIHARENIRVNALCPGPLRTKLLTKFLNTEEKRQRRMVHIPMGRFGEAREMASSALFLASDESSYLKGAM
jgi:hypothetical protein